MTTNFDEKVISEKLPSSPPNEDREWSKIPLGVHGNETLVWDLKSGGNSLLITGAIGSGKTNLMKNILSHCLEYSNKWRVLSIDPKQELLPMYRQHDSLTNIANTLEESVILLRDVFKEMKHRYEKMISAGVNYFSELNGDYPAIIISINEASWLLTLEKENQMMTKQDNILRQEMRNIVRTLGRQGRYSGIHLVLEDHDARAFKDLPDETCSNIMDRISLGRISDKTSHIVFGLDTKVSEVDAPLGKGYFSFYANGKGKFQPYYHSESKR